MPDYNYQLFVRDACFTCEVVQVALDRMSTERVCAACMHTLSNPVFGRIAPSGRRGNEYLRRFPIGITCLLGAFAVFATGLRSSCGSSSLSFPADLCPLLASASRQISLRRFSQNHDRSASWKTRGLVCEAPAPMNPPPSQVAEGFAARDIWLVCQFRRQQLGR